MIDLTNKIDSSQISMPVKEKKQKQKKPVDKNSIAILVGIVVIFILVIVYIFNIGNKVEEPTIKAPVPVKKEQLNPVVENQMDIEKIEAVVSSLQEQEEKNPVVENQMDMEKVSELASADEDEYSIPVQNISDENSHLDLVAENRMLKSQISILEAELRAIKVNNAFSNSEKKSNETSNSNKLSDEPRMKKFINSVKERMIIKDGYFVLDDRNYYIGDMIDGLYEVRDIRKNSVRFCDVDWCYSVLF